MLYLVTGGAGFIGSHLVEALLSQGCKVRVYDNFSTGQEGNLDGLYQIDGKLDVIHGDIRDSRRLANAMAGTDGVFHMAAMVSVPGSIERPDESFDTNSRGTQLVLNEARKLGICRVVLSSSAAVYGDSQNVPLKESEETAPLSPYGLDKLNGERLGALYSSLYGMNVTCLRFFNVFGPRQLPDSSYSGVISIFSRKISLRQPATIYGQGDQVRDFVFVKDVANALILSMQSSLAGFQVYNVGSGTAISIRELWRCCETIAQVKIPPDYQPSRIGDIKNSLADIGKISNDLAFSPSLNFMQNLLETYKWSLACNR